MEDGARQLTATDLADITDSKQESFGTLGNAKGARLYRYVKFGGNVVGGNLLIAPALVANHQNIAVAAAAAKGATSISVTLGATAATVDQYAAGTLVVGVDGSGVPITRRIKGNTAGNASTTITVVLEDSEPLLFALTTSNVVSLAPNIFNGVTASATAGQPVGVAVTSASSGQFGWVQTFGTCGIVNDAAGALAALVLLKQSGTVAGAVVAGSTAGDLVIGNAIQGAAASKSFLAKIDLE